MTSLGLARRHTAGVWLPLAALLSMFLSSWRGSPEEGRRSGFDSHEFNGRRSLHRVRLPDGISKLVARSDKDDQQFDSNAS